jgi:hypothetical protein
MDVVRWFSSKKCELDVIIIQSVKKKGNWSIDQFLIDVTGVKSVENAHVKSMQAAQLKFVCALFTFQLHIVFHKKKLSSKMDQLF